MRGGAVLRACGRAFFAVGIAGGCYLMAEREPTTLEIAALIVALAITGHVGWE